MEKSLFVKSLRALGISIAAVIVFIAGAVMPANAQEMSGLYRYVLKSGGEVYAAKYAGRKKLDAIKNIELVQQVGFVYIEPAEGTVPIYSLRKLNVDGPPDYHLTVVKDFYNFLQQQKDGGGWKPYPEDKGIIGYVRLDGFDEGHAAYAFQNSNNINGLPRYRIGGKEVKDWKNADKLAVFEKQPDFWVWKDKFVPVITGEVKIPIKLPNPKQHDLGLRKVLYHNGKSKVLSGQSPYGTPDKPLVLSRKDALSCTPKQCTFNLGFYVTRDIVSEKFSTYAMVTGGPAMVGNSVVFPDDAKSASLVLGVAVKDGTSVLTVTLKPYDAKNETNLDNNSFKITVQLNP